VGYSYLVSWSGSLLKKPRHVSAQDRRGGPVVISEGRTFDQHLRSRSLPRQPVHRHDECRNSDTTRPHNSVAVQSTPRKPCAPRWLSPQRPGTAQATEPSFQIYSRASRRQHPPLRDPSLPHRYRKLQYPRRYRTAARRLSLHRHPYYDSQSRAPHATMAYTHQLACSRHRDY